MQEYDDNKAVKLMCAALEPSRRNEDAVFEVLDLIFDYYEDNGYLDLDFDEDDDSDDATDLEGMVAFISKTLAKNPAAVRFSDDEIAAMVKAETAYEESLQ